ncbi:NADP-dependent phosphogluconate dehydrogenase [Candidatus Gracilibacteria bacterium]|nr:NADP-dependent phosphogluconate dehydrogenase [Candidatus Gracilibacteria bacterium]
MSTINQIGIIGLGVMGASLAQNFASHGITTSVYNRSFGKTQNLLDKGLANIEGFEELEDFVNSLESPKKIILLIKSGEPVDLAIKSLIKFLDKSDIIVDFGNSFYKDTERRQMELQGKVRYLGCGISGGEEGALHGPSIMPGGDKNAIEVLLPLLQKVVAKDFAGLPCVTNVGKFGAGHFVKMVHNGIEYAIMQGIVEIYDIMRSFGLNTPQIAEVFRKVDYGNIQSYLLDITISILSSEDKNGEGFLVEKVFEEAKAKGTGGWTVQCAIEFGAAVPSISAAVFARIMSARNQSYLANQIVNDLRETRVVRKSQEEIEAMTTTIFRTLEMVYLGAYLQGLDLIKQASDEKGYQINMDEVVRIWQGGCIIRSQMLSMLDTFWQEDKVKTHKILYEVKSDINYLRMLHNQSHTPKPVLNATYDYFQTIFAGRLPSNLIQAQRDFFGAHTYRRIDRPGDFTGGWNR